MGRFAALTDSGRAEFVAAARHQLIRSRFPRPGFMELFLTARCTLRCPYCFVHKSDRQDMSWETAVAALEFLLEESGGIQDMTILFFGGEPMLRMDLIREFVPHALRQAKDAKKRLQFSMTTNGTLLTEPNARFLRDWRIKYLISIDGLAEDHDRNRRFPNGRGSWNVIV